MDDNNRVLVIVDPTKTESQVAISRGAFLAQKLNKDLELLICYYDQYLGSQRYMANANLAGLREQMVNLLRKKLDDFAEPLKETGLNVEVTAIWDQPLDEAIVRYVKYTTPSIVVKETHYHNKISRALFTHTDWNLVRNCPAPLWLARDKEWNDTCPVIASVDPMQEHDKPATLDGMILDQATALAGQLGNKMHVFHSYFLPVPTLADGVMMPTTYRGQEVERQFEVLHKKALNRLLDGRDIPKSQIHLQSGPAHTLLPDLASDISAGLVVMGAVSRSRIRRAFIGSTAERVLPLLPCDLLIVKPDWFVSVVDEADPELINSSREEEAAEVVA